MLNCACCASTSCRRDSIELDSFFFEPLQLHLQPTDLLVQFGHLVLIVARWLARSGKDLGSAVQQPTLPLVNLCRMHTELTRQFTHCAHLLYRGQRHLGHETRVMLSLPRHPSPPEPRP